MQAWKTKQRFKRMFKKFEECPNPSILVNSETGKIIKVRCMKWSCKACGRFKAWILRKKIMSGLSDSDLPEVRMITLTIPSSDYNQHIAKAFNIFRTNIRKQGYEFKYVWVKEYKNRKSGEEIGVSVSHLHVLTLSFPSEKVIAKAWMQAINDIGIGDLRSWVDTHVDDIHIENAGYISKYLSKQEEQRNFEHRERRYGNSRGFFPTEVKNKPEHTPWTFYTSVQFVEEFGYKYADECLDRGYTNQSSSSYSEVIDVEYDKHFDLVAGDKYKPKHRPTVVVSEEEYEDMIGRRDAHKVK